MERLFDNALVILGAILFLFGIYSIPMALITGGTVLGPRLVWLQVLGFLALGYVGVSLWRAGQQRKERRVGRVRAGSRTTSGERTPEGRED